MTALIPPPKKGPTKPPQNREERFTASGTWTKPPTVNWVEVFAAGGGGGGGNVGPNPGCFGGGGGGGGVVSVLLPVTGPVPVVIGAGGTQTPTQGNNGGDTVWGGPAPVTALGGGGGGHDNFPTQPFNDSLARGLDGGSGGGGARASGGGAGEPSEILSHGGPTNLFAEPSKGFQGGSGAAANQRSFGGRGIAGFAGGGAGGPNTIGIMGGGSIQTPSNTITPPVTSTGGGGVGSIRTGPGVFISGTSGSSGLLIVRWQE